MKIKQQLRLFLLSAKWLFDGKDSGICLATEAVFPEKQLKMQAIALAPTKDVKALDRVHSAYFQICIFVFSSGASQTEACFLLWRSEVATVDQSGGIRVACDRIPDVDQEVFLQAGQQALDAGFQGMTH